MAKAKVSEEFAQFETRSAQKLAEARTAEKQSRGNPLPIGYNGVAVITDARAFISSNKNRIILVEATVVNDPQYEGKTCAVLIQMIKDTENQTATEAYARALDGLEELGVSRQTRETCASVGECFDELLNSPHYVSIDVVKNTRSNDGKQVNAFACPAPGSTAPASGPVAEDAPPFNPEPAAAAAADVTYPQCLYLGKAHYIISDNEDGTSDLQSVRTGKVRESVSNDDFETDDE